MFGTEKKNSIIYWLNFHLWTKIFVNNQGMVLGYHCPCLAEWYFPKPWRLMGFEDPSSSGPMCEGAGGSTLGLLN